MKKQIVFTLVLTFASFAHAGPVETFFPKPRCNVSSALKGLRNRLVPNIDPLGGDVPWPGVLGVWTNLSRGIYITADARRYEKNTWINVSVRSLCGGELLATGIRALEAKDWDRSMLKIQLVNYGLRSTEDLFNLSLRAFNGDSERSSNLDVRIGNKEESYQSFIGSRL